MTTARMKAHQDAAIAAAKAKLDEALKLLDAPLTDAFERRAAIRHAMKPGWVEDEVMYAKADAAHGRLELLAEAIRAAIEVAR